MTLFMWAMLILPWITLFWMKKDAIRRYFPVAIFTSLIMTIYQEVSYTQKFWILNYKIEPFPQTVTFTPFVYGLDIPITMWIFYFTFRRFWIYVTTNVILDAIFAFVMDRFFQAVGVYKLLHTTQFDRFVFMVALSILIYIYQIWQEKGFTTRGS